MNKTVIESEKKIKKTQHMIEIERKNVKKKAMNRRANKNARKARRKNVIRSGK